MYQGALARSWAFTSPHITSNHITSSRSCSPCALPKSTPPSTSDSHSPPPPHPQHWSQGPHTRIAAALAAAVLATSPLVAPPPSQAVTNEQLLFLEAWRAVDRAYVDKKFNGQNWFKVREDALKQKLGSREATYGAIRTLLASLGDPFTRFLVPEQYDALRRSTSGAVTGIGVEVSFASKRGAESPLVVIAPAPGGPADRAGIRPGDEILSIDDQPTAELSLYAAGGLLQGAEGSEVTLKVKPHTGGAVKDVKLTRQPIQINPVDSALCSTSGTFWQYNRKHGLIYYLGPSFIRFTVCFTWLIQFALSNENSCPYLIIGRH